MSPGSVTIAQRYTSATDPADSRSHTSVTRDGTRCSSQHGSQTGSVAGGPDAVFVDDGGVGGGVVDRLRQLGFWIVQGVNFGAKSDNPRTGEKAANKRSEMWLTARAWLESGPLRDDPLLAAELSAPMFGYNAQNALILEKRRT